MTADELLEDIFTDLQRREWGLLDLIGEYRESRDTENVRRLNAKLEGLRIALEYIRGRMYSQLRKGAAK